MGGQPLPQNRSGHCFCGRRAGGRWPQKRFPADLSTSNAPQFGVWTPLPGTVRRARCFRSRAARSWPAHGTARCSGGGSHSYLGAVTATGGGVSGGSRASNRGDGKIIECQSPAEEHQIRDPRARGSLRHSIIKFGTRALVAASGTRLPNSGPARSLKAERVLNKEVGWESSKFNAPNRTRTGSVRTSLRTSLRTSVRTVARKYVYRRPYGPVRTSEGHSLNSFPRIHTTCPPTCSRALS